MLEKVKSANLKYFYRDFRSLLNQIGLSFIPDKILPDIPLIPGHSHFHNYLFLFHKLHCNSSGHPDPGPVLDNHCNASLSHTFKKYIINKK